VRVSAVRAWRRGECPPSVRRVSHLVEEEAVEHVACVVLALHAAGRLRTGELVVGPRPRAGGRAGGRAGRRERVSYLECIELGAVVRDERRDDLVAVLRCGAVSTGDT
jgi:hypothetical protein